MGDVKMPNWLKKLPLAPEFHPTDTEFADPIAYISKIEKQASAFGICKVIPPLPKPSKKFVFSNLNKSLAKSPELGSSSSTVSLLSDDKGIDGRPVFTTRHQELGHNLRKGKGQVPIGQSAVHKQVWQSGEVYTLEQFESKSKAFAKMHLGVVKEVTPLVVEALFWKAAGERSIYIEYANDVPGSGFGEPEDLSQYFHRRRRGKINKKCQMDLNHGRHEIDVAINSYDYEKDVSDQSLEVSNEGSVSWRPKVCNTSKDGEGTAGWKLSNSPWNLQVIARSPGSLTRFMADDIPGVTSPMIYIGMLFSWFAWHVEDHELHSLNFLHTGSSKTWYAVPGDYAFDFEEVIRSQGYGGKLDRLAALTLLGEKTNLLSPEVVVASGIPCCRLVQNPGEFVVTFPRAYHVGFSHGFNCGEAANFGTPQWLKVAKEAAIRRAAMNYLPMLSHQQLLYLLTMSFLSRVPRTLLPGERTSRLKDRQKEEREVRVKKEFIEDMLNEHKLLSILLGKESTFCAVLWDPDSLPMPSNVPQSFHMSAATDAPCSSVSERGTEICFPETSCAEDVHNEISNLSNVSNRRIISDVQNAVVCPNQVDQTRMHIERSEEFYVDDDDLPCGLHVDSGTLPCVACGILGFPFMSIIQPSERASEKLFPVDCQTIHEGLGVSRSMKPHAPLSVDQTCMKSSSDTQGGFCENKKQRVFSDCGRHVRINEASVYGKDVMLMEACHEKSLTDTFSSSSEGAENIELKGATSSHDQMWAIYSEYAKHLQASKGLQRHSTSKVDKKWNTYSQFLRPRVFCLEHALETEELLCARGGANVLIICHSAYPKIKAHALSVAEEIGATFNCDEVPLVNASKEDLDLINISICDEGHDECGEDWTSRLGVNIHHCVKLRKLSQEKQEHALALGGLFTETVSSSDVSSLKWNSRRSRTSHKVTARNQSKSCRSADTMKADIPVEKQERSKAAGQNKILQYYRRNRKKVSHGHHRKQQLEEESRLNGLPYNVIAQNSLCSTSDKQHECPTTEETREMISDPENFACSAALENTGNDSHKLETFATVENLEILQEVPKAGETSNENRGSDRANAMLLFWSDSTRNDAVELASSLVDFERQREGEEMKGLISDPAKLAGSIASENIEKDNHKLTFPTLENMEVLEVSETEETVEKYEVSVCANDLVSKIERTSNSTVAWESSVVESFKLPYNICMTVETCRSEEVLDSAKSTVLRAVHDLVLQNLEKQMKNQVLGKFFVEGNSEMQHEVRTVGGDSSGGSDNRMSAGLPASSTTFTRNFDAEMEGRIVEETVMEEEACNTLSDTVRRPQCSPTVMRASKTMFCDFADEICHVSHTVSRLESIPKVPETGESMEKNEASDSANAAVPSDTERTGNDTFAWESSPHNICMTSETSRAEEVVDSAKSAVLRAVHDLVLQSLEKQMKNELLEEVDIEDNSEMQHDARTIGFDSNDGSDPRNSPGLPPVSTSSSRHFDAEVEDRIVEESVLKDKACKIISDTFGRLQSSQTVMGASEARVCDSVDVTCQQSNIISIIESSGGERENIEEVNMGGDSVTMVPESTHTAAIYSQPTKRDRHKRKREVEEITEDETNYDGFIRSPCEGLRPRVSRFTACVIGPEVGSNKARRPSNDSFDCKEKKENMKRVHWCDLEGCQMSFETNSELTMHKCNRCTHEGCGKQFSSHRYMMLHQKVHVDERPLNCQWKGCKMSFKWTWARTEHMRVHTGERPYRCKIDGCGLTFRYTSDFSRHRRKTGHGVNANS